MIINTMKKVLKKNVGMKKKVYLCTDNFQQVSHLNSGLWWKYRFFENPTTKEILIYQ